MFTCSGGESALSADAAAAAGLELPPLSEATTATIAAELPWYAGVGNPLDYNTALWGHEEPLTRVFAAALADGADVALLVIDHPRSEVGLGEIDAAVSALERACSGAGDSRRRRLDDAGVVPGRPPGCRCTRAASRRCRGCATRSERSARAPRGVRAAPIRRRSPSTRWPTSPTPPLLDEYDSKRLVASRGVAVPEGRLVEPSAAGAAAAEIGFPVAVKLCSADLPHKADAGALALGLTTAAAVDDAVAQMLERNAGVSLSGVLVEQMVGGAVAELLVGIKRDPVFGPVVVVGAGGGLVELIGDARPLLAPVTRPAVEAALRSLRTWPRIARGDVAAAVDAVLAIAGLAPDVVELDVNPLLVLDVGCVAADALVRTSR